MSIQVERMARELTTEDRDLWDQQPDEPKLWFDRFDMYRLIGPGRSIAKAYRKYRLLTKGQSSGPRADAFWYDYAKEWKWEERAIAWDDAVRSDLDDEAYGIFNSGLSLSHERIRRLSLVAAKLEEFILDDKTTRISPYVIEQYRLILDDIAKERGERQKDTRISIGGGQGNTVVIETSWGRGNAANERWQQLEPPKPTDVVDAVVEEVKGDE